MNCSANQAIPDRVRTAVIRGERLSIDTSHLVSLSVAAIMENRVDTRGRDDLSRTIVEHGKNPSPHPLCGVRSGITLVAGIHILHWTLALKGI